ARPDVQPQDRRVDKSAETKTWTVDVYIIAHKLEAEGDCHVILQNESGDTMTARLPDPERVGPSSPWVAPIAAVRQQFVERFHPGYDLKRTRVRARVTGVGF